MRNNRKVTFQFLMAVTDTYLLVTVENSEYPEQAK